LELKGLSAAATNDCLLIIQKIELTKSGFFKFFVKKYRYGVTLDEGVGLHVIFAKEQG
jgi:hypothetical protein